MVSVVWLPLLAVLLSAIVPSGLAVPTTDTVAGAVNPTVAATLRLAPGASVLALVARQSKRMNALPGLQVTVSSWRRSAGMPVTETAKQPTAAVDCRRARSAPTGMVAVL